MGTVPSTNQPTQPSRHPGFLDLDVAVVRKGDSIVRLPDMGKPDWRRSDPGRWDIKPKTGMP